MTLSEKVAHLKGLEQGRGFTGENPEQDIILEMTDILEDTARSIDRMREALFELEKRMNAAGKDAAGSASREEDSSARYEVVCPSCGRTISVTEEMLQKREVSCPGCGTELEFDLDDSEDASGK